MDNDETGLQIAGCRSAFDTGAGRLVSLSGPSRPRPPPLPAFADQDLDRLAAGMDPYAASPREQYDVFTPTSLRLFTLEQAWLVIYPGLDGLIVDRERRVIEEPSCFCRHALYRDRTPFRLPAMTVHPSLGEAFAGFDAAWTNYYHWLAYALLRTGIAATFQPPSMELLLPDIMRSAEGRHLNYAPRLQADSLALFGLADRVRLLGDGLYPVRRLHFFWHTPRMPENFLNTTAPHMLLDRLEPALPRPDLPARFVIMRRNVHDPRLTEGDVAVLEDIAGKNDLPLIDLATCDLATQRALFHQAELVIAPHGAGLANLLMSGRRTRVLELNRCLDGQQHLRSCFYLIASRRNIAYMTLDLTGTPLTGTLLQNAIDRLLAA